MFDPYHKWLGIPLSEQPPNHYRLLGIALFEGDLDVIDTAANRQMAFIQGCATGPHTAASQKLLNELAAARVCLLNPAKKAAYDEALKAKFTPKPKAIEEASVERVDEPPVPKSAFDYEQEAEDRPAKRKLKPKTRRRGSRRPLLFGGIAVAVLVAVVSVVVLGKRSRNREVVESGQPNNPVVSPVVNPPKETPKEKETPQPKADSGVVDLLRGVKLSADESKGPWKRTGSELVSPSFTEFPNNAWVLLPRLPFEHYRIEMEVERLDGPQGVNLGLLVQGRRCLAIVDGFASAGGASGLEMVNGKSGKENTTTSLGLRLPANQKRLLAVEVRKGSVRLFCEGEQVFSWSGEPGQLSLHPSWQSVPEGTRLFLGTQASFKVHRMVAISLEEVADPAWTPLFNGKDLTGWRVATGEAKRWSITGGALVTNSIGFKDESWLMTERGYGDFVLRFEFQAASGAGGGVAFRVEPSDPMIRGLKFMDDAGRTPWAVKNDERTGVLWSKGKMLSVKQPARLRPVDEWNDATVELKKKVLTVTVNGEVVQSIDLGQYANEAKEWLPFVRSAGRIAFQCHSGIVKYRNIEIREMVDQNLGWTPLFNGKDLTGWKVDGNPNPWKADAGELVCDGPAISRRGTLLTEREFSDITLRFEFRLSAGGVGGITLRAVPGMKAILLSLADDDQTADPAVKTGSLWWPDNMGGKGGSRPADRPARLRPVGEWNQAVLEVRGTALRVAINGEEVAAADLSALPAAKSTEALTRASGRIGLQNHNDKVLRFRKIEVTEPAKSDPPIGTWVEERTEPAGDRIREFRPDGTLTLTMPKSGEKHNGTWKWDQGKVYLSVEAGKAPAEDRWFTIVRSDEKSMTIMMMGIRQYVWKRK